MAIVAEKTGYPSDMLAPDLDLEADLGIDTVKQAETFAAVREAYGIPRDEKLKLRDFPTLARVVDFVYAHRPDLRAAPAPAPVAAVAPAAPPPLVPPAAAPAPAVVEDAVKARVMAIVAEKTGYPSDMLDADLDLEADLGIDTVKQAETFAAVREAYGIPRDEKLKLRDFPTLARVVDFVYDHRPDLKAAPAPAAAPPKPEGAAAPVKTNGAAAPSPLGSIDDADRTPRRVPVPVVRPALALCKATGVSLEPGSRVVVMRDRGGVADALIATLARRGVETLAVEAGPEGPVFLDSIAAFAARGAVQGLYWLPALDVEPDLAELDIVSFQETLRVRVKLLAQVMRALYAQIAPPGTFLVTATRMGGCHGYDEAGATAPLGGAVAGFTKAYKRERGDALVKVVDFELGRDAVTVADLLVAETLADPGAVEIGYQEEVRWSVGLVERPPADGQAGMVLGKETVFVVSGAAGSIVAAIVADLAAASGGVFHLLDLAPLPDPGDADLVRYEKGEREALKRDLFDRIKARGERATPAQVERDLAALERSSAALHAIRAVEAAGGAVHYHRVDLRDPEAVARAIAAVRAAHGRVDVLLHAAGLEVSRPLADKDPREFDLVLDVKALGWFNLLHAAGDMPIGAAVAFSSIAGRFGNAGQTDYSAANDLLCKLVASLRRTRPSTRGLAIDWTAWAGIGMASRGSIPKAMEAAGIDMLAPESGVPVIRRELTRGGAGGEIVVGGRLGVLIKEWDETGGVDLGKVAAVGRGPFTGKVRAMGLHEGLVVEATLDPKAQPFLDHHRIEGTPVLPGVMGVEAFAEVASLALPGWHVAAVEDVTFAAPFKLYRDEPRDLTLRALMRRDGADIVADCTLEGSRVLAGRAEPQVTTHFTGRVRLVRAAPDAATADPPRPGVGQAVDSSEVYRFYFHGPAYRVVESAWIEDHTALGRLAPDLPPDRVPADAPLVTEPRLLELVFQTAGLWERHASGRLALPQRVERLSFHRRTVAEGAIHARVRVAEGSVFDAEIVDAAGNVRATVYGYRTVALPAGASIAPDRAAVTEG
jgi:NAD(P)-dependent dehydrogenase (short-subunit alcohol dehydrogenase family)/acyl carrier protein